MRYDVFISYSSIDQKIAEGVCAYLEQQGIRCFVAYRDIPRGVVWATAIVEALENSRMMVVLFSKNFNDSSQVEREIELASNMEMPILTFRLSDVAFRGAKKYYLQNLNWIDAFPNPERSFSALYGNVASLLGIAVSDNHVKQEVQESRGSKSSNLYLWIVIGCLSVALIFSVVFSGWNSLEDDVYVGQTDKSENINKASFVSDSIPEKIVEQRDKAENSNHIASESDSIVKTTVVETVKAETGSQKSYISDSKAVQDSKVENAQEKDSEYSSSEIDDLFWKAFSEFRKKNYIEAKKFFKKAAEQGHVDAQYYLGRCYEEGKGVSKNLSEAKKWYQKAVDQGSTKAQYILDILNEKDEGRLEYITEAKNTYIKEAEQWDTYDQYDIGFSYENDGVISNTLTDIINTYIKEAEQGDKYAQYKLGLSYQFGVGVSKKLSEAIKWYKKSADQGYEPAIKALERLKDKKQ